MNRIIYVGKHLLTFSVTNHAHSSWELVYCTSGEGRFCFESGTLPYREGDLMIIPPFTNHRNESEQGFTNIHMNMLDPALHLKTPLLIRDDGNHFIRDAFQAAFYHYSSDPGGRDLLLPLYANLIVGLIQADQSTPRHSPVVEEIAASIILNYPDENYALDDYLRSLPFNTDYLRKLFRQEIGVTPHRYLSDIRLQTAAENLVQDAGEGSSITEIARNCGFRDALYFSRMFRKKFGLPPSEYQQRFRKTNAALPDGDSVKIRPADA